MNTVAVGTFTASLGDLMLNSDSPNRMNNWGKVKSSWYLLPQIFLAMLVFGSSEIKVLAPTEKIIFCAKNLGKIFLQL